MFLLKKLFKLRDHTNPEEEKPFLDHLEDLRKMITRMGLTLLISTLVCFGFRGTLMEVIQRPVHEVWEVKQQETLGTDINLQDWEKAIQHVDTYQLLKSAENKIETTDFYWEKVSEQDLDNLVITIIHLRAIDSLPAESQLEYAEKAYPDQKQREVFLELKKNKALTQLNQAGNIRMMSSLKPTETFMLTMKLAFFAGVVIAFPFLLYFLLQFIIPGLKDNERKALWPSLAIGFGLFLCGAFFAYFFVLPTVLHFFYDWGSEIGITNDWRIGYYISFATQFVLIFGLAFELPVVVMTLVYLGILSYPMMSSTRSYAVVAIMIIAAIITPTPDIPTLMLLAAPMYILYELCIWLAFFFEKKQLQKEQEEEREHKEQLIQRAQHNQSRIDHDHHEGPSDEELGLEGDSLHHCEYDEDGHPIETLDDPHHQLSTEEGEQEDIGDPLDDEETMDVRIEDQNFDPLDIPDDEIPEEERNRDQE